jgi:glycosyltransferase involved in cell wall biosynthesis
MDRAVREASGDVVVTLDCDDTYPVEVIPRRTLVEGLRPREHDADVAPPEGDAVRELPRESRLALAARVLHGLKTTDVHSGMRAYRKSMLEFVQWSPRGPALPVDMYVIPFRRGFRVTEIPIDYRERIGQTTLHRFSSTWWTFKRLWKAR